MSAVTIMFIVGTHFLALLIGMVAHSLFLERADHLADAKAEVVTDPDIMAIADIFIPKK